MVRKPIENTGELPDLDDVFVDEPASEATQEAPEASPPPAPTEEEQEDLENAGINISEADEKRTRARQRKAFDKEIEKLGIAHGSGKKSMISLAERITEAAMNKTISATDAEAIYDNFREAADTKGQLEDAGVIPDAAVEENAPIESSEDSRTTQLSKLRNFIELGNKFDDKQSGGAADLIRRARNIHIGLLSKDRKTLKKGSTYTILVSVATNNKHRKQAQGVMTDAEIHEFLSVPAKPEKASDEWSKIEQALNAAVAGRKGGRERPAIDSPHLDAAIEELRACLGEGAPERLKELDAEEDKKIREANDREDKKNAAKGGRKKAA